MECRLRIITCRARPLPVLVVLVVRPVPMAARDPLPCPARRLRACRLMATTAAIPVTRTATVLPRRITVACPLILPVAPRRPADPPLPGA